MAEFDIAVVGGGINGAGIARDAAGRGLKVLLVEQGDLAQGTSSALDQADPRRVAIPGAAGLFAGAGVPGGARNAAKDSPHLVHPMRFVLPLQEAWAAGVVHPPWPARL